MINLDLLCVVFGFTTKINDVRIGILFRKAIFLTETDIFVVFVRSSFILALEVSFDH